MNFQYLFVFIISSMCMIAIIDAACANNNVATTELPLVGYGSYGPDPRRDGCSCSFRNHRGILFNVQNYYQDANSCQPSYCDCSDMGSWGSYNCLSNGGLLLDFINFMLSYLLFNKLF